VRSTAATSRGFSTTQITERSRAPSPQTEQGSVSVRLPQTEQYFIRRFASRIASAIAFASPSFMERMWKASLCALLPPIPGSPESARIKSFSGFA
jgi:hypothetical protein